MGSGNNNQKLKLALVETRRSPKCKMAERVGLSESLCFVGSLRSRTRYESNGIRTLISKIKRALHPSCGQRALLMAERVGLASFYSACLRSRTRYGSNQCSHPTLDIIILNRAALFWFKIIMAERVGFEPTVPCGTVVFKTTAFDHSATSPELEPYIPPPCPMRKKK